MVPDHPARRGSLASPLALDPRPSALDSLVIGAIHGQGAGQDQHFVRVRLDADIELIHPGKLPPGGFGDRETEAEELKTFIDEFAEYFEFLIAAGEHGKMITDTQGKSAFEGDPQPAVAIDPVIGAEG